MTLGKAESAERLALAAKLGLDSLEQQLAAAAADVDARVAQALEAAGVPALRAQVQALAQQGQGSGAAEAQLRQLGLQQVRPCSRGGPGRCVRSAQAAGGRP
jgi:hypothetical protein